MYDDNDPKKKAMAGIHGYLGSRMAGRLETPEEKADFEASRAPSGDSGPMGHDSFHCTGADVGNATEAGMESGRVARGESPVNDVPDSDPGKEAMELTEDGSGLGQEEKDELASLYDKD